MTHHHIFAFSTSCHHISPLIESSQSPQQASLEGTDTNRLLVRHTSAHSSLVFAHTEEISGDIA